MIWRAPVEFERWRVSIPVVMDVKGKGELSFFRAKTYVMHDDSEEDGKETVYGRHGWQYFVEDFLRCRLGGLNRKKSSFNKKTRKQDLELRFKM